MTQPYYAPAPPAPLPAQTFQPATQSLVQPQPIMPVAPVYYQQPVVQPYPAYNQAPAYPPYGGYNRPVVVVNQRRGPGLFVRIVWYIFIGWWAGFWWMLFGYFLCLTGIGLPVGLYMLNRLPQVMTLKPMGNATRVDINGDYVSVKNGGPRQHNFFLRAVYFLFVGWWVGGFWCGFAYGLIFTIIGIPFGLLMLNVLPTVMTLRRNADDTEVNIANPVMQPFPQQLAQTTGSDFQDIELSDAQINFRLGLLIFAWSMVPLALIALFIFHR